MLSPYPMMVKLMRPNVKVLVPVLAVDSSRHMKCAPAAARHEAAGSNGQCRRYGSRLRSAHHAYRRASFNLWHVY